MDADTNRYAFINSYSDIKQHAFRDAVPNRDFFDHINAKRIVILYWDVVAKRFTNRHFDSHPDYVSITEPCTVGPEPPNLESWPIYGPRSVSRSDHELWRSDQLE